MTDSHPYYTKAQLKTVLTTRLRAAAYAAEFPKHANIKPKDPKAITNARAKVKAYDSARYAEAKALAEARRASALPLVAHAEKLLIAGVAAKDIFAIIEKIEALGK